MDDIKNTVNILERIAQRTFSIYECGALETAISALQELEQYRLREQMQWIPARKRLPENGARVLVTFEDGFVAATDYYGNGWDLWADSGDVIAWMPSPEPYHPEPESTASEPLEWERRMMNTFLGSRQEKKTDKTGTAEITEKERL